MSSRIQGYRAIVSMNSLHDEVTHSSFTLYTSDRVRYHWVSTHTLGCVCIVSTFNDVMTCSAHLIERPLALHPQTEDRPVAIVHWAEAHIRVRQVWMNLDSSRTERRSRTIDMKLTCHRQPMSAPCWNRRCTYGRT